MARKKTLEFAESALGDLEDIRDWYTEQQVPEVGKPLVSQIVLPVERLVDFPETGRVVPEFGLTNLRELIQPPFRIVYRLHTVRILIIRVWRSERLLKVPDRVESGT